MRITLSSLLIFFLASCPLWCATAELDHALHSARGDAADTAHTPAHCPTNDDDCVCHGAIQPGVSAHRGLNLPCDAPPVLFVGFLPASLVPAAGWAGPCLCAAASSPARPPELALLQSFRC